MKKGRQNYEGFVGYSVVSYGRSLIFGRNQFSPKDFVGQNWGTKQWILHIFLRKSSCTRNRKLASCNMDVQPKYDSRETASTSDAESCSCHGEPRTGIEVCGQQYHAVHSSRTSTLPYSQARTQKHPSRLSYRVCGCCAVAAAARDEKRQNYVWWRSRKRENYVWRKLRETELCFSGLHGPGSPVLHRPQKKF